MSRRSLLCLMIAIAGALVACGPNDTGSGDDDGGSDTCSGDAKRCVGAQYQVCQGGHYVVSQTCPNACDVSHGGCVECVAGGGNTCRGNDVVTCNADGTFGTTVMTCPLGSSCDSGTCQRTCTADGVDLIYVVDETYNLLSFDPRLIGTPAGPYHVIGHLNCPNPGTSLQPGGGAATPFSMAVDRNAVAWVLYSSGKLYKVSTADASCQATSFTPQQTVSGPGGSQQFSLFGMAYVSDTAGGDTEKLFIGGGNVDAASSGSLGWIDTSAANLAVNYVHSIAPSAEYSAELTGLGDTTLWLFFPDTTQQSFVTQLDKTTGAGIGNPFRFDLAAAGRQVQAWAFAQWGGKFYVFVTTVDSLGGNQNATVHEVDRASGAHSVILQNQPYPVVGAGVSTCAPVTIGRETPAP